MRAATDPQNPTADADSRAGPLARARPGSRPALIALGALAMVPLHHLPDLLVVPDPLLLRQPSLITFFVFLSLGLAGYGTLVGVERLTRGRVAEDFRLRLLIGGVALAALLGVLLLTVFPAVFQLIVGRGPRNVPKLWLMSSILGTLAYACALLRRDALRQRQQALELQLEADRMAAALARAELAVLETQIEPHFLFNTLAHIKRHYRLDAAAADRMLGALIDYLDRALPALRRDDWTLGDELDLIRIYLGILQQRFASRLSFAIHTPDDVLSLRLPALTIATLAENAVRHGLGPKAGDGRVEIRVETTADGLRIQVRDDGVGLRPSSGSGLGLAGVRARLQSVFGSRARLSVEGAEPCGVLASIVIGNDHADE